MLDYKLIEAMAMVVREGGFDKAARALNITQSAVSQRVKLLEELTGQILVARTAPPRTTSAGRRLLKHYLQVKRLEDDLIVQTGEPSAESPTTLAIGLNADSLATWFPEAIGSFLRKESVLLDLRVDDQDRTHRMLKDGDVVGCISTMDRPLQGCRMDYLGCMPYQLTATPEFAEKWFPRGVTLADTRKAPAILFNRKDELHHHFLRTVFGDIPYPLPTHYVPSSEKFPDVIAMGFGYGMLPAHQCRTLIGKGRLIDLIPGRQMAVKLYWHCWNLKSELLEKLTRQLIDSAKTLLEN